MTVLYTIGFTRTTAQAFFERLQGARVRTLVDVRLKPTSQLAGFAKQADLPYFLDRLVGATYVHRPDLAPTAPLLSDYRNGQVSWPAFEEAFTALLHRRRPEDGPREPFSGPTALLCSEATADRCHRRLVAEHLSSTWEGFDITHL